VAICIILINREENEGSAAIFDTTNPEKLHFWLVNILQFFFGGLLSAFIVLYFRSSVLAVAWPFFLLLITAFCANQFFKRHYTRIGFQISFFFLCIYLFAIFYVPVLLHQIGREVFLMSGGISLIALLLFLFALRVFTKEGFKKGKTVLLTSIVSIYIIVNAFYFLNLIPPLPLSLEDAGIYHSINKNIDGNYTVTYEQGTFWDQALAYVNIYPTYHEVLGAPVYAYSAVFSPIAFDTTIIHQWQHYDSDQKKWITVSTVSLPVIGGRENGYRTYSLQYISAPGAWRVNVQTSAGQLIGRMLFTVTMQEEMPQLSTETKT